MYFSCLFSEAQIITNVAAPSINVRRSPRKPSAVSGTATSSGLCISPGRAAKQVTYSKSSSPGTEKGLFASTATTQDDSFPPCETPCTPYNGGIRRSPEKTPTPLAGHSSSDGNENHTESTGALSSGVVLRSPRKLSGVKMAPTNINSRSTPLTTATAGTGKS